jgi:nucleotide-binding universal stress UspA family protein
MQHETQPDRRIVVGVDGSSCSEAALRWAIAQAQLVGVGVEAIAAWQDPVNAGYSLGFMPALDGDVDWATLTEKVLRESVARVVDQGHPGSEIVTRVVQGHPAQVLLDAAASAQLLVVGSRGHGTLAGMLLGSVSQHCVQHAPCPVVVVPNNHPAQTPQP